MGSFNVKPRYDKYVSVHLTSYIVSDIAMYLTCSVDRATKASLYVYQRDENSQHFVIHPDLDFRASLFSAKSASQKKFSLFNFQAAIKLESIVAC